MILKLRSPLELDTTQGGVQHEQRWDAVVVADRRSDGPAGGLSLYDRFK